MNIYLQRDTESAFIWTRIFGVPFWGLISLLSIILYKDMKISQFQIAMILSLKPMSALLAPYWSQMVYQRPERVMSNLVWANILRYLPFLFIPWVDSAWIIIAAFGFYMMFYRGIIPAWMETIKNNLPSEARERLIAYGSFIDYCGSALLPLGLGFLLDTYESSWRWLFFGTAILGLVSTWFLYKLPRAVAIPIEKLNSAKNEKEEGSIFKQLILKPWKQSWQLVREHSGFAHFQIAFMLGGAGLMFMQPVLPTFFVDTLNLSYTKMLFAITMFKGIGFALTSPLWVKFFRKLNIFYLTAVVTTLAALFPLILLGAQANMLMLYFAYCVYGMMQAGSELTWHMSGPAFAEEKDSVSYSSTNVLTIGLRGCIVPSMGALVFSVTNSTVTMLIGSFLCLLATQHLVRYCFKNKLNSQLQN